MGQQPVLFVGRTTVDAIYWLETLPAENTKIFAKEFLVAPGGPAMNAAITNALLGGKSHLVTAIGRGQAARIVQAEAERLQIRMLDLAEGTDWETPLTSVLINGSDGSRTVVNPPVASAAMWQLGDWEHEAARLGSEAPHVVLLDGFYFSNARKLVSSLRDAGASLVLDAGSLKPGMEELAGMLTVSICSETFVPQGRTAQDDPEEIIRWFESKGVPNIAVTRGSKPIIGRQRGRRFEVEIAPIQAVDTLGAGDVLHGAFCHFFSGGLEFEPALRRASECATLASQYLGVQAWAEKWDMAAK